MTVVKEKAYAKINLYLDVLGIREDGFHNIKTVMHTVTLADDLTVSVAPSRSLTVSLSIDGNRFLPNDSKNLVYKAAVMFYEKIGISADVKIKLIKRIPVAAGLAGGSSDAAATLRALNKIHKRPFTTKALLKMGEKLGSDVPYCIIGKTALCEGRGEQITKIRTPLKLNCVIANSGEHVSTPEAYSALDRQYSNFDGSVQSCGGKSFIAMSKMLSSGILDKNAFYNIFETPILEMCPRSSALKDELLSLGAKAVMMSGSGPSLFAVFECKSEAENAKCAILAKGYSAWCVSTV